MGITTARVSSSSVGTMRAGERSSCAAIGSTAAAPAAAVEEAPAPKKRGRKKKADAADEAAAQVPVAQVGATGDVVAALARSVAASLEPVVALMSKRNDLEVDAQALLRDILTQLKQIEMDIWRRPGT